MALSDHNWLKIIFTWLYISSSKENSFTAINCRFEFVPHLAYLYVITKSHNWSSTQFKALMFALTSSSQSLNKYLYIMMLVFNLGGHWTFCYLSESYFGNSFFLKTWWYQSSYTAIWQYYQQASKIVQYFTIINLSYFTGGDAVCLLFLEP